jgi:hypothetical protein
MELSELAFSLILSTENVLTKKIVPYQILYTQNPHENMKSRKIFSATNGPKLAQTGPNWPKLAQTGPNWPKLAQTSNYFSSHNVFDGH